MARQKIQLQDGIKRVAFIETEATIGADIGVNLRYNGVAQTLAQLQALLGTGAAASSSGGGPTLGSILTTKGDLATRDAQVQRLPIGAANTALRVVAGLPAWVAGAALTKTDDTNVTITLGGTPASSLLAAASITLGWAGTLAAIRGGTGFGAYTAGDTLYANTTTTLAKLGIGSTGDVLRVNAGAPAWQAPSNLFANPSATIGLTAVNGSASTGIRSDGAPALSQAIVPTWTGVHTFAETPVMQKPVRLAGYTVGTLPAGVIGDTAYVTDALAPTWGAVLVGGGAIVTRAFFNGAAWVAQ